MTDTAAAPASDNTMTIEQMRAAVAASDAAAAQKAADDRAATLKPATDLLASDEWKYVAENIGAAAAAAATFPFHVHFDALANIINNLNNIPVK